jgi:hypothetical protein
MIHARYMPVGKYVHQGGASAKEFPRKYYKPIGPATACILIGFMCRRYQGGPGNPFLYPGDKTNGLHTSATHRGPGAWAHYARTCAPPLSSSSYFIIHNEGKKEDGLRRKPMRPVYRLLLVWLFHLAGHESQSDNRKYIQDNRSD